MQGHGPLAWKGRAPACVVQFADAPLPQVALESAEYRTSSTSVPSLRFSQLRKSRGSNRIVIHSGV
jgi:hypothetical protein